VARVITPKEGINYGTNILVAEHEVGVNDHDVGTTWFCETSTDWTYVTIRGISQGKFHNESIINNNSIVSKFDLVPKVG
jgi:hypothetical protein